MSTTADGRSAEQAVANYLQDNGHKIVVQNWRTRWCEIDIVSKKKNCVFFTEVKFRKSDSYGDGLAFITPTKVRQMRFAAEFWLAEYDWTGDAQLLGAGIDDQSEIVIIEIDE